MVCSTHSNGLGPDGPSLGDNTLCTDGLIINALDT